MRVQPDYLEFMATLSKLMPNLTPEQDLQVTKMLDRLLVKQWQNGYNSLWGQTYGFLHWNNKELCSEWEQEVEQDGSATPTTERTQDVS